MNKSECKRSFGLIGFGMVTGLSKVIKPYYMVVILALFSVIDSNSIRLTTGYFIAHLLLQTCVKSGQWQEPNSRIRYFSFLYKRIIGYTVFCFQID